MRKKSFCAILAAVMVLSMLLTGCTSSKLPNDENIPGTPAQETDGDATVTSPDDSTPIPESSWTVVIDTEIPHQTNIAGFLNENYGISVEPYGKIHCSNDGGQTWAESENSSMCRFSLDIVDEDLAWSGGAGNHVRVSSDGGKTWSEVSDINMGGGHSNIDFVDDTTGWITTLQKCAVTKDGGVTWTELELPEDADSIAAICLRTADNGYLLTHRGLLFTTADGGTTWSSNDLGLEAYEICNIKNKPELDKNNVALADISFSDENNGIIVFTGISPGKGRKTWCLTTGDGGASWTAELLVPPEGFTPTKVFISGDCKYITLGANSNQSIVMKSKN